MKRTIQTLAAGLIACGSFAAVDTHADDARAADSVAAQTHMPPAEIKQAELAGLDMTRIPASPGLHIVPLEQSPFVGAVGRQAAREFADREKKGALIVRAGEVPDLRAATRSSATGRHRRSLTEMPRQSLESIRPQLRYEPISVEGTVLERAKLVEATTAGGLRDGRWTGVTRAWEVAGLGYVQLDESEYRESGGSITVVKEWLNAEVNGSPASIQTKRERRGKALVSLGWITDSTTYRLDLQPRDPAPARANETALLDLARSLGM